MLLKSVREVYNRYLADPASDPVLRSLPAYEQGDRHARNLNLATLFANTQPFIIDEPAVDLVATLNKQSKGPKDLGPLLLEVPLPFPSTWLEYQEELEGEGVGTHSAGVLIRRTDKIVFAFSFHRTPGRALLGSGPIELALAA